MHAFTDLQDKKIKKTFICFCFLTINKILFNMYDIIYVLYSSKSEKQCYKSLEINPV